MSSRPPSPTGDLPRRGLFSHRYIFPLQTLGQAPTAAASSSSSSSSSTPPAANLLSPSNSLFTPSYVAGNAAPKCSFVDSDTVVGVDDNLLKLYDVQTGNETVEMVSEEPEDVACPVQQVRYIIHRDTNNVGFFVFCSFFLLLLVVNCCRPVVPQVLQTLFPQSSRFLLSK